MLNTRYLAFLLGLSVTGPALAAPTPPALKCVAFSEPGFPIIDSEPLEAAVLRTALSGCDLSLASIADLTGSEALKDADLLVLPYGSAFPAAAWESIRTYMRGGGNLLNAGGRPFAVPVRKTQTGFEAVPNHQAYAREIGLRHSYVAPRNDAVRFAWGPDFAFLPDLAVRAREVFVTTAHWDGGHFRGLGYLVAADGTRISAPVTRSDYIDDRGGLGMGGSRSVFLSFHPEPGYWSSPDGQRLLEVAAQHAARGASALWLEVGNATLAPAEPPQVVVHLQRGVRVTRRAPTVQVHVELRRDDKTLESRVVTCTGDDCRANVSWARRLPPGFYELHGVYDDDQGPSDGYVTGLWSRDQRLLRRGASLQAEDSGFRLDGKPYLPVGVNYFSTDVFSTGLFVGGNPCANAYRWEQDFAAMERRDVTFVRTGTWLNQLDYQDEVTGGVTERYLRAVEAFLHSAARHGMQVQFTFFSFNPQIVRQAQAGGGPLLGPGANAFLDPVSIRAQSRYVHSIVSTFKDVPFLCWDLINEPNFDNPARLWSGNQPNGDAVELTAWRAWLHRRYDTPDKLAEAWNVSPTTLGGESFGGVPIPDDDALRTRREGSFTQMRAFDFNLFAQESFTAWVRQLVSAVRQAGGRQLVSVGQDEGGVTDRLLDQFFVEGGAAFTSNHPWWSDDALLWDAFAARRSDRPGLFTETGTQPAWRVSGEWRYDETTALALTERKLALGFAAGTSGSLHWDWSLDDVFGLERSDGSDKVWMEVLQGIAAFARESAPHTGHREPSDIAVVLPQSLQLSVMNRYALGAQQACVRTLYHDVRADASPVGEYQLNLLGDPRLIIVPSAWVLSSQAWETLLQRVEAGAVLAISGPLSLDEHFRPAERLSVLSLSGETVPLLSREVTLRWGDADVQLTFGGDKTTTLDRERVEGRPDIVDQSLGKGRVLYCPWPLELNDNREAVARFYRLAIDRAGVERRYETTEKDPGILICPTPFTDGTLYVLTSESSRDRVVEWHDRSSGAALSSRLPAGRATLAFVARDGRLAARYGDVSVVGRQ